MLAISSASHTLHTIKLCIWARRIQAYRYEVFAFKDAIIDNSKWYDLKEKDLRPKPNPASHPSERKNRFFDSTGPGGVQTPKPPGTENILKDAVGGQYLEIDRHDIQQFAHYGYVYCMLLGKGILPEAPTEEVLVSGGGDGRIVLWRIHANEGGAISSICTLEDGREEGESILSLARDGTFLYSGRFDGEVNVWDLETRQLVRNLKADTGDVLSLSLGGGFLFAGGISGVVQVRSKIHVCICPSSECCRSTTSITRQSQHSERTTDLY